MYSLETKLVQFGNEKNEIHGAVSTPLYLTTAYKHEEINQEGFDYIRTGNPTRQQVEAALAKLEGACASFACSSGMAALDLVFSQFKAGSHFIVSRDLYGGSYRLFENYRRLYQFRFTYWDEESIEDLIQTETVALLIETPSNPLMKKTNLENLAQIAKKHQVLLIVDSTLATPIYLRPIELGADIVVHSGTKYLAGHNDVLAGFVAVATDELAEKYFALHNARGAVLSPFDSYLVLRGLKTLHLRMEKHTKNALEVVEYLKKHPKVVTVYYPGNTGMLSFEIKDAKEVAGFLKAVQLFSFAESFGGVESFVTYPMTQTHMDIPKNVRESYGLSDRLLRLSVGIEAVKDLIADLDQALRKGG